MKRLIWMAFGVLLTGFFVYRKWSEMLSVAIVLLYMTAFSLLLAPVCTRMERRGVYPRHAAAIAVVGVFLIVFVLLSAFIPYLISKSVYLFKRLSPTAFEIVQRLTQWADGFKGLNLSIADIDGMLGMTMSNITGALIRAGMTCAAQIGRIAFSLVLTYYVLCDRKRIGCHLLLLVPVPWRRGVLSAICACRNAMMSYFAGLLKTSAFVACATAAGLMALGIQDAIVLALLMGVFEILPYIGPILASIPILLSAMMYSAETALLALGMLIVVQQIEGNFVTPYFTASSTAVHPLLAILGVFVIGNLFGLLGILAAIPMIVLGQSLIWSLRQAKHMMQHADKKFCACDD